MKKIILHFSGCKTSPETKREKKILKLCWVSKFISQIVLLETSFWRLHTTQKGHDSRFSFFYAQGFPFCSLLFVVATENILEFKFWITRDYATAETQTQRCLSRSNSRTLDCTRYTKTTACLGSGKRFFLWASTAVGYKCVKVGLNMHFFFQNQGQISVFWKSHCNLSWVSLCAQFSSFKLFGSFCCLN